MLKNCWDLNSYFWIQNDGQLMEIDHFGKWVCYHLFTYFGKN